MLKEITALANKLDRAGNTKIADMLDKIIEKSANDHKDIKDDDRRSVAESKFIDAFYEFVTVLVEENVRSSESALSVIKPLMEELYKSVVVAYDDDDYPIGQHYDSKSQFYDSAEHNDYWGNFGDEDDSDL